MWAKSKAWMTEKPLVAFMVPDEAPETYAAIMNQLASVVQGDLGWGDDAIELVGMISATAAHGMEGLFFLEELGVDPRTVTLLIMWGDTAESARLEDRVSVECGVGKIILVEPGVVLPTLRLPSITSDWWLDPLHREYATSVFTSLVQDGRVSLTDDEPYTFVSSPHIWN